MAAKKPLTAIGVIGGGDANPKLQQAAAEVGAHIARNGVVLVCGGLGGIMEAAAKGAWENGGVVVGLLPGEDKDAANPYCTVVIPTGFGIGRNILVVRSSDVIIAFPGAFGTLSEIALSLNLKKTVVCMPGSWDLKKIGRVDSAYFKEAFDPGQAVGFALNSLGKSQ
ncbi:MAG: TIGR00725 family protein [Chitinivibrionales bacterium]